jgi:hypothetical protein
MAFTYGSRLCDVSRATIFQVENFNVSRPSSTIIPQTGLVLNVMYFVCKNEKEFRVIEWCLSVWTDVQFKSNLFGLVWVQFFVILFQLCFVFNINECNLNNETQIETIHWPQEKIFQKYVNYTPYGLILMIDTALSSSSQNNYWEVITSGFRPFSETWVYWPKRSLIQTMGDSPTLISLLF